MKKILQLTAVLALSLTAIEAKAQLPNGSIAPDWTLTDINGVSHNLYTDLNAGKTVYIDVSATWCGPCWAYHGTGALENLWVAHGPTGGTGVSAGTTNDVMVYFIEGDGTTGTNALHGISGVDGTTQGDWVTGVSHPIIDPAAAAINTFNSNYSIAYFPTIYMICPNRVITEVGQVDATALYAAKASCPAPAAAPVDAALLASTSTPTVCDVATLKTRLQNNSTTTLTACTIIAKQGATTVATYPWSGSLATYAYADITLGTTPISANTTFTYSITTADAIASNNTSSGAVNYSALQANSSFITVKITCDQYGSETKWKLKNAAGTTVGSGGPYTNAAAAGSYPQTDVNLTLPLGCYTFELTDAYGDGFTGSYGSGSATVVAAGVNVIAVTSFTTDFYSNAYKIIATGIEENQSVGNVTVYPNPITNNATVNFNMVKENNVSIVVVNALGQSVLNENLGSMPAGDQTYSLDATKLENGLYFLNITVGNNTITKKVAINK
ncbi:MAG: T9SS type A sorting domain-containing protein [Bacteroidetes bacterium]|nr:T9SS type A sorting domain-containing protein [Bacteroidota bacterium]